MSDLTDAQRNDLKKSYRSLMMKFHPDRNPNEQAMALAMSSMLSSIHQHLVDNK